MSALDTQVGGTHYKNMAIQPIEFIQKNKLGYEVGNIIKYVTRYQFKNGVDDLKKARHYLDLLIESIEPAQDTRPPSEVVEEMYDFTTPRPDATPEEWDAVALTDLVTVSQEGIVTGINIPDPHYVIKD